jgi:hypothetical protein
VVLRKSELKNLYYLGPTIYSALDYTLEVRNLKALSSLSQNIILKRISTAVEIIVIV